MWSAMRFVVGLFCVAALTAGVIACAHSKKEEPAYVIHPKPEPKAHIVKPMKSIDDED